MTITGTNSGELLNGTAGNDTILGLGGHDDLRGLSGNDSLDGGDGFDTLNGGLGDDVLTGGGLGDWFRFFAEEVVDPGTGQTIVEGFGHDTITDFGPGDSLDVDTSAMAGGVPFSGYEIIGDDTILRFGVGTAQESSIALLNYHIAPGEFAPGATGGTLFGNIQGVISHDDVVGTANGEWLDGYAGNDTLRGLDGSDRLYGGKGDDTLFGGADEDDLFGDEGDDTLDGGDEHDEIWDGAGNDVILAGNGNDDIYIVDGNDTITTGSGNDNIDFKMEMFNDPVTGNSVLLGIGHNVVTDFAPGDHIDVDAGQFSGAVNPIQGFDIVGNDTVIHIATGSPQESSITILNYHVQQDEFYGGDSHFLSIEGTIKGLLTPEHLVGSDSEYDELRGYGGNDTLEGLALEDDLYGGAGDDTLYGGADRDWLYSGTGNDTAEGGDGDDVVWGEFGDNLLSGGNGEDELQSGQGNDTMSGGSDGDEFHLEMHEIYDEATGTYSTAGFGHDVVLDFSEGDVIYVNTIAWDEPGNAFSSHEFVGSDTVLRWGVGTPQESSLTIKNYHLPAVDIDPFDDFMSFYYNSIYFESPLNEIFGHPGVDNLLGTSGDDWIIGLGGSDNLQGATGNDVLDPGAGGVAVQNVYGHTGDDTYLIGADSGKVRISTWAEKDGWGHDWVVFKTLTLADVSVTTHDAGGADGERLVIAWYDQGVFGEVTMAHLGAFIEEIEFSDGQVLAPDQLTPGLVAIDGTSGDDTLRGSNYDEILAGGLGTDHLQAAGGDDILDPGAGGPGIQFLYGQLGDDTYRIGYDVGLARINIWAEDAASGVSDTVQFTDLVADDLSVALFQGSGADGLELRLTWDHLGVTGELQLADQGQHIEAFVFSDGEVLTAGDLLGV